MRPRAGYTVFAGCFLDESEVKLKAHTKAPERVHCIKLDVTSDDSVAAAAKATKAHLAKSGEGLVGVINCAGVGYNGPAEYFPMEM